MDDLDRQILLYGDLSDEERAEVERRARTDPARAALLAETRALHAFLAEARAADADVPDATALAEYVVGRHTGRRAPPPEVAEQYARIEAALRERPELERQARAFLRALEHYASEAEDPAAQFERLTGRALTGRRSGAEPAAPAPARPPLRLVRSGPRPLLRRALAACVALVAAYGALAVAGRAALPERQRMADLGAIPDAYEGIVLRGPAPGSADDPTAERYARALARLDAARRTTLGLFPRYDAAALDAAARDLTAVAASAEPGSWEGLEATFLLGRIRLHQGRDREAAAAFTTVVEREGPSAPEARRLLDWLDSRGRAE